MNTSTHKIVPCLWFDKNGEDAARLYVLLFPDSRIDKIERSPADYPSGKAGDVLTVSFTLAGRPYLALNGGPEFKFDEAVSFQIDCADQAEVDHYWDGLLADGGKTSACGWLKDKFGFSWQVIPRRLTELMADPDRAKAKRVMEAMMGMIKINVADIEAAAHGK